MVRACLACEISFAVESRSQKCDCGEPTYPVTELASIVLGNLAEEHTESIPMPRETIARRVHADSSTQEWV